LEFKQLAWQKKPDKKSLTKTKFLSQAFFVKLLKQKMETLTKNVKHFLFQKILFFCQTFFVSVKLLTILIIVLRTIFLIFLFILQIIRIILLILVIIITLLYNNEHSTLSWFTQGFGLAKKYGKG